MLIEALRPSLDTELGEYPALQQDIVQSTRVAEFDTLAGTAKNPYKAQVVIVKHR